MSGEIRVTPPSVGDVLLAGEGLGWPAVRGAHVEIAPGAASWRTFVTEATAAAVWKALHEADLDEGDAADADDENDREEDDDEDGAG